MGIEKYADDKHKILNINKHINDNNGYKVNHSPIIQSINDRTVQKPTYQKRKEK